MQRSVEAIIQRQRTMALIRTYVFPALGRFAAIGVGIALGYMIATV